MLQNLDTALTYAATVILFGSFLYFPIAFAVFVVRAEAQREWSALEIKVEGIEQKKQALKVQRATAEKEIVRNQENQQAAIAEIKAAISQIETETSDVLPDCPFERDVQAALARDVLESMSITNSAVLSDPWEDDAAISEGDVPLVLETPLPPSRNHRSAALRQVSPSTSVVIPSEKTADMNAIADEGPSAEVMIEANPSEIASDDVNVNTSMEGDETASLPSIVRNSLTIWKRRGEQVVTTDSIPVTIPDHIQRLRWRNAEVIQLADLKTFAEIV